MKKPDKQTIRAAFLSSLPVMAGYLVLGMGFGLVLKAKGYGILWSLGMSLFIYAGSMQYVAVDLIAGGASLAVTALTTLMVNARHLFYGISMVDRYRGTGKLKPYLIFALTDETYSLVCEGVPEGVDHDWYCFLLSAMNQCYWVTGSLLGSVIGTLLRINSRGIDFSLTALFIAVFVEQWKSNKNHLPALIGVALSVVSLCIFGPSDFLIPAMLGIAAALSVGFFGKRHGKEAAQ